MLQRKPQKKKDLISILPNLDIDALGIKVQLG